MSITIGFGYSTEGNVDLFNELQTLSNKFDYGLFSGIDMADVDICRGVATAQKNNQWDRVVFLQSPIGDPGRLAFGIDQELTNFEIKGIYPKFFDFLIELTDILSGRCLKLGVFFSGDWYETDRVRYSYGAVGDLITLLSLPGHWGIRYMIPETGHLQDSDEIPLIFDLQFK